tara:strand:+ start:241 stop:1629 length:1389 start_codon:yes stop_codon:yes gene_type:complete
LKIKINLALNPNVILLVIDSFRSDKFFHSKTTSKKPNIDNLIKNGTYFSQAISSADATILSWSGLYTGKYPFKTGIRSARFNKLDENTSTLFDIFRQSNYTFFSFTPTFSETIGLFPKFQNQNNLYDFTERLDSGLGDKILNIFSSLPTNNPWFLNIHLMDLHFPLVVPTSFKNESFGFSKYEQIISSMDQWIGIFVKKINFDNTILIITADHGTYIKKVKKESEVIDLEDDGESEILKKKLVSRAPKFLKPLKDKIFFMKQNKNKSKISTFLSKYDLMPHEKRALLSGNFSIDHELHDEKIRVPLLFVGSGIEKNIKFSKQVQLTDVLPSICYLAKIKFNYTSIDGQNLFPLKSEDIFDEKPVYIESNPMIDMKSNDVIGIRTSKFKYFRDKDSKTNRVHLFNLSKDPNEENNIAESNTAIVSEMESLLDEILEHNHKLEIKNNDLTSNEIENELRKMGYV